MPMHIQLALLLNLVILFSAFPPLLRGEEHPLALVIGNARYLNQKTLVNTLNDARDIQNQLRRYGFEIMYRENAKRQEMNGLINQFIHALRGNTRTALFYYSGHGLQVEGVNYLVPVDAKIQDELEIIDETVSTQKLFSGMKDRENAVNLIILDACRDNPFHSSRGGGKGLARVGRSVSGGILILYATRPGDTADDNPRERNGLFTKHLLKAMQSTDGDVENVFRQTAKNVYLASNRHQQPWFEGVLLTSFSFYHIQAPQPKTDYESQFWNSVQQEGSREMYQAYLEEYPHGHYVRLATIKLGQLKNADQPTVQPHEPAEPLQRKEWKVENREYFVFPVVGSFQKLPDAIAFAKRIKNRVRYRPGVYLTENGFYGVTLGGYLSPAEAKKRVHYARKNGIAKDAYIFRSTFWGENLYH